MHEQSVACQQRLVVGTSREGETYRFESVADCSSLVVCKQFLDTDSSEQLFQRLRHEQAWPDNHYEVFGRRFKLPRLQTWHADPGIVYSYSDNLLTTMAWTPLLLQLKASVEHAVQQRFNAVLVNYYRDEDDYVGWHSDDEIELGAQPFIASLSLGASREFAFRRKHVHAVKGRLQLDNGCLLLMHPEFQQQWQHAVLPGVKPVGSSRSGSESAHLIETDSEASGRINLTFRYVYPQQV